MKSFDQLDDNVKNQIKPKILELYFKSGEWTHILNTALEIQKRLICILKEKETLQADDEILNSDHLENTVFSDFDMPASVRVAVDVVIGLLDEDYTLMDIVDHGYEIYSEIVAYWAKDIQTNYADWVESVGMMFNDDCSISQYVMDEPEIGNHLAYASLNGVEHKITIGSFKNLHQPVLDLGLITHFIDPVQTNLKIDDLVDMLYRLRKDQRIATSEGDATLYQMIQVDDSYEADFDAVQALGWIIDILAASESIDQFEFSAKFSDLEQEFPEHADFILFALDLYRGIDLTDKSMVSSDHVYWYLREINRHVYKMSEEQANAYASRMFNDDSWEKFYTADTSQITFNPLSDKSLRVELKLSRLYVEDEAMDEYAHRLDENGDLPQFLAWDDSGEITLRYVLSLNEYQGKLSASFDGVESATMNFGEIHLSSDAVGRITNCIGKSTLADDVLEVLGLNTV